MFMLNAVIRQLGNRGQILDKGATRPVCMDTMPDNAEQPSSTTTTNGNDHRDKLDSQTTTSPGHHQTCKRGDLSSNASVAWMALPMYHAVSRRFACFGDGSSFAQLRVCMSRVGPISCTICWQSSQPLSADVHILVPRGSPRAACSFRASFDSHLCGGRGAVAVRLDNLV